MKENCLHILLADHHPQALWALKTMLSEKPGFAISGEATNAEDLLAQAIVHSPDLVLMDGDLPGLLVEDTIARLHACIPRPIIIVMGSKPETGRMLLKAGADAFISKSDQPGSYDYDEGGAPIPGTYKEVLPNPQDLLSSALKGPINGIASGFAGTTLSDGLIGRLVLLAFVVMVYGVITDTVLYWAEQAVAGLGGVGFIIATYVLYIPFSFLIPSTSGLATVSMPTMAPLAQFAGVAPYLPGSAF